MDKPKNVAVLQEFTNIDGMLRHRGIARYAHQHADWHLLHFVQTGLACLSEKQKKNVDGIISGSTSGRLLEQYHRLGLPTVYMIQTSKPHGVPMVCADNAAVGRLAAEHLLGLGLRNFAYLELPMAPDNDFRRDSFASTLLTAGYPCRSLYFERWWDADAFEAYVSQVQKWLQTLDTPLGVMTFCDYVTVSFMSAVKVAGYRVPDDVAVVGVDDDIRCEFCKPMLSSINLNADRIGYEAAALLDRLLQGEPAPDQPILIPPLGVMVRASTDMLAVEDEKVAAALRLIRLEATDGLHVLELAERLETSERSLELKFRQCLGRTPQEELWRVRTEKAKKLLAETDWTLVRIAVETGFSSASHLSRVIKQETGQTPKNYRHSHRHTAISE